MIKAILIKYHRPTNTNGTRFSAQAYGSGRKYYGRDYGLEVDDNAEQVAREYAAQFGWTVASVGELPTGDWAATLATK